MKLTFFTLFFLLACFFALITAKKAHKLRQDYESSMPDASTDQSAPPSLPDMPEEEPKILAMEEERLQNNFLRQQQASYSHEVDRKLPNGAAF